MEKYRKFSFIVILGVVFAAAFAWGLAAGVYHLPPYAILNNAKDTIAEKVNPSTPTPLPTPTAQPTAVHTGMSNILALIENDPQLSTTTSRIDFVREFVYNNSIHQIDEEFDEYAYDTPRVLDMLYDHSLTGENPPHLACDPRTYAMEKILRRLGFETRVVMTFTDEGKSLTTSHTFLEVFNTDTQAWEVQDPDYNVYYLDQRTQTRVSAATLLMEDLSQVQPISSSAKQAESARNNLMPRFFEAMVFLASGQDSFTLINTTRYEVSKIQAFLPGENAAYAEFRAYVKEHFGDFPVIPLKGSLAYPDGNG